MLREVTFSWKSLIKKRQKRKRSINEFKRLPKQRRKVGLSSTSESLPVISVT